MQLSICIIARNEAQNIARCLDALKTTGAEILVLDTGSTDRTREIAAECGARVETFVWCDDFSAARNHAASLASHDRILAVDCDEILQEADLAVAWNQMESHPDAVGMIERISPTVRNDTEQSLRERVARCYDRTLFCYSGSIHENVTPVDGKNGISYYELPMTFLHSGYETAGQVTGKANRDLDLLRKALEKDRDDPYIHYQTGKCYVALKEPEQAMHHYETALALKPDNRLAYVQDLVESYGYCLLDSGKTAAALDFMVSLPEQFLHHADFCFLLGLVYMNNTKFPEAVQAFEQATQCESCSVDGCDSYRAYYNIGVIWEVTGNMREAYVWYEKCGDYPPALARKKQLGRE